MPLLNDQERYSVYVGAKIVIYFDCTIFLDEFFIGECILTSCVEEISGTLQVLIFSNLPLINIFNNTQNIDYK